jgi:hypothetical protein
LFQKPKVSLHRAALTARRNWGFRGSGFARFASLSFFCWHRSNSFRLGDIKRTGVQVWTPLALAGRTLQNNARIIKSVVEFDVQSAARFVVAQSTVQARAPLVRQWKNKHFRIIVF